MFTIEKKLGVEVKINRTFSTVKKSENLFG